MCDGAFFLCNSIFFLRFAALENNLFSVLLFVFHDFGVFCDLSLFEFFGVAFRLVLIALVVLFYIFIVSDLLLQMMVWALTVVSILSVGFNPLCLCFRALLQFESCLQGFNLCIYH
jgi:hypothetical protein